MPHSHDWEDDAIDPLRGPKGDTAFLRSNYKFMAVGGVFRTPKAKFPPAAIHAEAAKAGWCVEVTEDGPWLKVKVVGKVPAERKTAHGEK